MSDSIPSTLTLSSTDIECKAAPCLAGAGAKPRATLAGVDATAVFSNCSLHRMAAAHSDRPSYHTRPTPVGVELAACLLYPEFGRFSHRDGELILPQ